MTSWTDQDQQKFKERDDHNRLRELGIGAGVGFIALALLAVLLFTWRESWSDFKQSTLLVMALFGLALIICAFVKPMTLKAFEKIWNPVTWVIATVMGSLILSLSYLFLLVPLAFFVGKRFRHKLAVDDGGVWEESPDREISPQTERRQF